jgi:MFS transporter, DHA1 family, inner membrane transport protein
MREPSHRCAIAAMIVMGISGATMMVIMPGAFAALASGAQLGPDSVAWLAFGEMTGITVATIGVSFKIRTLDHRTIAGCALVILALADGLSAQLGSLVPNVVTRLIAGLAEGVLIANMASLIAKTAQPDRLFALYMACNLGTSTVLLAILGVLVASNHGRAIFYILILIIATAAVMLVWIPRAASAGAAPERVGPREPTIESLGQSAGLIGTLILFVGLGASWPQVAEVGRVLELPPEAVPFAMSVATFMGIVAGLFAALCGTKFGRRIPVICGTLILALSMVFVANSASRTGFTVAVSTFMFSYIYIVPYYTGIMARLDRHGRMASFSMAMQFLGLALGPLASTLVIRHGLAIIFWTAAVLCIPSLVLILVAEARGRSSGTEQVPVVAGFANK